MCALKASLRAANAAGIEHFVFVSVAQPAPVIRAYIEVRAECESLLSKAGLNATILRPWYVLGPGHRWPIVLQPIYRVFQWIPHTREAALRLGLVTLQEMLGALLAAIEQPATGVRVLGVREIRALGVPRQTAED